MAIAKYTLAVDRKFRRDGEQTADFIRCVEFGKNGEFAERYLSKGMKICVCGRIQTGNYTNQDGNKVYTTDVIVEEHTFCERKGANEQSDSGNVPPYTNVDSDGFTTIPDGIDEDFPFC